MHPEVQPKRGLSFDPETGVEITVATNAGACFGVVRAIKLGNQAAQRGIEQTERVYSLGPLVHTPQVVQRLAEQGVRTVDSADEVETGTVVLRSHGVRKEIEKSLRDRGVQIVDATCPLVKKPQRIAQALGEKGYFLIVVGNASHPEIKGVVSYFGRPDFLVTYDPADVAKVPAGVEKVGVLAQTTIEASVFGAVAEAAKARFADTAVYNTICDATSVRQREADQLARQADIVIVVGGKNSSNTSKLAKICREHQPQTFHVESMEEIDAGWLKGKNKIAVLAGAATPIDYVDSAAQHIARLLEASVP